MILDRLDLTSDDFHRLTGWELKPEGACKDDRCVPLGLPAPRAGALVDVAAVAERLRMPVVYDPEHALWALGPESGGRVLETARAPEIRLDDFDGHEVDLGMLRGRKVLLVAWASW